MIILIVQIHVKADAVTAFEAATEDNAANSRLEPDVVRFDVLQEQQDPTRFALAEDNAANSRLEPDVVRFDVLQEQQDPTRFALVEVYRDQPAVAAHKTTTHYLRWRDAVADLMAEPRVGVAYANVSPSDSQW